MAIIRNESEIKISKHHRPDKADHGINPARAEASFEDELAEWKGFSD